MNPVFLRIELGNTPMKPEVTKSQALFGNAPVDTTQSTHLNKITLIV